ncbi:PKD domain-containing protein [Aquimarina aquimarini]|uniref:PKD domain-containing protein n=1 Tax=Aquimarina aquimarini TaxID=1191734 RepID=UPI000D562C44|nr:PKD domain-containing protein [Aquimarina aquimarini]
MNKIIYILIIGSLILGCAKEEAIPVITDFNIDVFNEDFSVPVQVVVINKTEGADEYQWEFEGGVPSSSVKRNPGIIQYETPGQYAIILTARNIDGSTDKKTIDIQIDMPVVIDFKVTPTVDNFTPARYHIDNNSTGANSFLWSFEGGIPATSSEQNPAEVEFFEPGEHTIKLEISNGRETYDLEHIITVAPYLVSGFTSEVAFDDDDFQAPVRMQFTNTSVSATSYAWDFQGATPSTSTAVDPEITFTEAGIHTVTLTATNGKEIKSYSTQIEVVENTNLRTYTDIALGINTAHLSNATGSMYNFIDRKVYTTEELTATIEEQIDLVFFGLNNRFERNRFVSPDALEGETTFLPFTTPKKTIFINSQELCGCTASLSANQFDTMNTDALLASMNITETSGGVQDFDKTIHPRIVLFQTQEGKKGAIKVKQFVEDGQNSYILIDIKIQKEAR